MFLQARNEEFNYLPPEEMKKCFIYYKSTPSLTFPLTKNNTLLLILILAGIIGTVLIGFIGFFTWLYVKRSWDKKRRGLKRLEKPGIYFV